MSATNLLLLATGIGSTTFALWGHYTQVGQQSFEGIRGMIPIAAGAFGGMLLILAALLTGYRSLIPPAEIELAAMPFLDAPRYSSYSHWVLGSVAVATLVLFDIFCRLTVGPSRRYRGRLSHRRSQPRRAS